jgi:hypothetical protein
MITMGFRLKIVGQDTLKYGMDIINSAHVGIHTPNDSMAKSNNVAITLFVSGNLLATDKGTENNSDTSNLFDWSLVPAQSADAYRDVTVDVITSDSENPFRRIHLPNAFIVNYDESYSNKVGVGEFSMTIRQKADKVSDVKSKEK